MGIIVGGGSSNFSFSANNPRLITTRQKQDRWLGAYFRFGFEVIVAYDKKTPTPPRPKQPEDWKIGIVQNVLYQSIRPVYENGSEPKPKIWDKPMLDAGSFEGKRNLPFYSPPLPIGVEYSIEGIEKKATYWLRASLDVVYGPDGIELKDPPKRRSLDELPDDRLTLTFFDEPKVSMPARLSGLDPLKALEHVIALRFWVMAIGPRGPVVLGASNPFTLVSWLEFAQGLMRGKALESAKPESGAYNLNGVHKQALHYSDIKEPEKLEELQKKHGDTVRMQKASPSTPKPVMSGPIANDEGLSWLRSEGLL